MTCRTEEGNAGERGGNERACQEGNCRELMANVTFMRVEGGVDMLEQQQRRWPDWCEDQRSYVSEHTGQTVPVSWVRTLALDASAGEAARGEVRGRNKVAAMDGLGSGQSVLQQRPILWERCLLVAKGLCGSCGGGATRRA